MRILYLLGLLALGACAKAPPSSELPPPPKVQLSFPLPPPPSPVPVVVPKPDKETIVLLAGPDGTVGKVAVQTGGAEQVLRKAEEAAGVRDSGAVQTGPVSPAVLRSFDGVRAAMPARAEERTFYFDAGTTLTAASAVELRAAVQALSRRVLPEVELLGYSDTVGTSPYNLRLAEARTATIEQAIRAAAVKLVTLERRAFGEDVLAIPTADEFAEPRNRRVILRVR